jgi:hypothetical protein
MSNTCIDCLKRNDCELRYWYNKTFNKQDTGTCNGFVDISEDDDIAIGESRAFMD